MSLRIVMAATATLLCASPALAAPALQAAFSAAPAATYTEEDMEARAEAFEAVMEEMGKEIEAAVTAGGTDKAKITADTDAVVTRYTPQITAFVEYFEAFLNSQITNAPDESVRTQMVTVRDQVVPIMKTIPDQIRASIQQSLAAQN